MPATGTDGWHGGHGLRNGNESNDDGESELLDLKFWQAN